MGVGWGGLRVGLGWAWGGLWVGFGWAWGGRRVPLCHANCLARLLDPPAKTIAIWAGK